MSLTDKWIDLVLGDLEDFRNRNINAPSIGEDLPAWAEKIDREIEKMMLPPVLKAGEKPKPKKVGLILGQTYGYLGWLTDCIRRENSALVDRFKRGLKEDQNEDGFPLDSIEDELRSHLDFGVHYSFVKFQHVLKRALSFVTERPFMEAAEFFEGFSASVVKRASDDSIWTDKYTTASAYFVMRRMWEFVETFKNVTDLHIFLQHKLGRGAAGDLDRTRTLAKRIGLKLAARGRPSKNWVKIPR